MWFALVSRRLSLYRYSPKAYIEPRLRRRGAPVLLNLWLGSKCLFVPARQWRSSFYIFRPPFLCCLSLQCRRETRNPPRQRCFCVFLLASCLRTRDLFPSVLSLGVLRVCLAFTADPCLTPAANFLRDILAPLFGWVPPRVPPFCSKYAVRSRYQPTCATLRSFAFPLRLHVGGPSLICLIRSSFEINSGLSPSLVRPSLDDHSASLYLFLPLPTFVFFLISRCA